LNHYQQHHEKLVSQYVYRPPFATHLYRALHVSFLSCEGSLVETVFELEENVSEKRDTAKKNLLF